MSERGKDNGEDGLAELHARIVELGGRLHDPELSSADNLGTRAGTLIGFAGVVLTLTVALSREAFGRGADLGSVGDPASAVLFLLAVLCLLAAAVQGVRSASPRERARINPEVFDTYRDKQPPPAAKGTAPAGLGLRCRRTLRSQAARRHGTSRGKQSRPGRDAAERLLVAGRRRLPGRRSSRHYRYRPSNGGALTMSDDDEQPGSQGEQGNPEASDDHDSEGSGSSDGPVLDRPNDVVEEVRGGQPQQRKHR